jgi:hypothetical protein
MNNASLNCNEVWSGPYIVSAETHLYFIGDRIEYTICKT